MYIVTVKFSLKPEHKQAFMTAMLKQAQDSLANEIACTQFDVALSEQDPNLVFLYEIYNTKEDFDIHLATQHFKAFSATVENWVVDKVVETFLLAS